MGGGGGGGEGGEREKREEVRWEREKVREKASAMGERVNVSV